MAAFATMAAAEVRARAMMEAGTWLYAYSTRDYAGTIGILLQRPMSPGAGLAQGGFFFLSDDATA